MEETLNVVINMLKVYNFDIYALLDLGANLSFVTPFLENKFNMCFEILVEPFEACTPVGESVVAKRVYKSCLMSILDKVVHYDLVELSMVDFVVILGIDWSHASYVSIDSRTCKVKF